MNLVEVGGGLRNLKALEIQSGDQFSTKPTRWANRVWC